MRGFAIILAFNVCGLLLQTHFDLPIPGNVLGLVLFLAALFMKIIKIEWVEESAQFLLKHMLLFFAPVIVGVILFFAMFSEYWLSIVISFVFSTFIVLLISGWVTRLLESNKQEEKSNV